MDEVVLDIQNLKQKVDVESWGKIPQEKLMAMVVSRDQKELDNGLVEITIVLDPKKGAVTDE